MIDLPKYCLLLRSHVDTLRDARNELAPPAATTMLQPRCRQSHRLEPGRAARTTPHANIIRHPMAVRELTDVCATACCCSMRPLTGTARMHVTRNGISGLEPATNGKLSFCIWGLTKHSRRGPVGDRPHNAQGAHTSHSGWTRM